MVRNYVPKTNIFGLDVGLFERYFGCKAHGFEDLEAGKLPLLCLLPSAKTAMLG